jgi:hypothetical protein
VVRPPAAAAGAVCCWTRRLPVMKTSRWAGARGWTGQPPPDQPAFVDLPSRTRWPLKDRRVLAGLSHQRPLDHYGHQPSCSERTVTTAWMRHLSLWSWRHRCRTFFGNPDLRQLFLPVQRKQVLKCMPRQRTHSGQTACTQLTRLRSNARSARRCRFRASAFNVRSSSSCLACSALSVA